MCSVPMDRRMVLGRMPCSSNSFPGALAVGRGGRMDHQGFQIRHIGQQGKQLQMVDEAMGFLLPAPDIKGKDTAAAVGKIPLIQRMIRMLRQHGMAHMLHQGMMAEIFHHPFGILDMSLHPQRKRLCALQE